MKKEEMIKFKELTDQLDKLIFDGFNRLQMNQIRMGFENGLTIEQVLMFAKPEYDWYNMANRRLEIKKENKK